MGELNIKKNVANNIVKYRNAIGMSQKELASHLGVVPSRVSNWETGTNMMDVDMLFKICDLLNVSINDIYGVYPDSKITLSFEEIEHIKKYRSLDDFGRDTVDWMIGREKERKDTEDERHTTLIELPPRIRQIPYFYKNASAGTGEIIFDNPPEERIEIPDTPENIRADYAIGVNGRSMEPLYNDGDILLVEIVQSIDVGEIGIFIKDEKSYVKQLGETELISINKEHDNITLDDTVRCMGKVVGKL